MPMPSGKLSTVFSKGAAANQKSITTFNVALTDVMEDISIFGFEAFEQKAGICAALNLHPSPTHGASNPYRAVLHGIVKLSGHSP